jgi:hypothetical protein
VAISAFLKRSRAPSTSTLSRPVNRAAPKNTSMPSALKRAAESTRLMRLRMRRMRSIASAKSTRTSSGASTPYWAALRISAYRRELRMRVFDGTQP